MELEFQESDIIFSSDQTTTRSEGEVDDNHTTLAADTSSQKGRGKSKKSTSKKAKKKTVIHTVPVDIPCKFYHKKWEPAPAGNRSSRNRADDQFYDYDDDGEMVPPHVIVGRRIAGKIAFSVCFGIGRTLKGRDLREVRNSVLRLTGFLES